MSPELVVIRRDDAIVHVVLNRPEKRNALNREVLRALVAAHEGASALAERRTPKFIGR